MNILIHSMCKVLIQKIKYSRDDGTITIDKYGHLETNRKRRIKGKEGNRKQDNERKMG